MTVTDDFFHWDYDVNFYPEFDDTVESLDEEMFETIYEMSASEWVETAIKMPNPHTRKLENFSFDERKYLKDIYDCGAKRTLFMCGRQVEKSTTLGNKVLAHSCLIPHFSTLYVSPSATQTKEFSKTRIKEMLETCEIVREWFPTNLTDNVFEKRAKNRSKIIMRYAFLNADRCRGLSADYIALDEFQDFMLDNIPVIVEASSHSTFKWLSYSGTPKSMDNPIQHYWDTYSTQNEWAVPCERHGLPSRPDTWHWNILDEANIGKEFLCCDKCGKQINPQHELAQWVRLHEPDPDIEWFEGFRIPQLMVPWVDWSNIISKYKEYPRGQFYNEVLGRSFDSGQRPLLRREIYKNCDNSWRMSSENINKLKERLQGRNVYAGIDWGQDSSRSYTVLTLGTYINDRFMVFLWHRFEGVDSEPEKQMKKIIQILNTFNVRRVGVDYGGGFFPNDRLLRTFGKLRVTKFQYSDPKELLRWDHAKGRFLVHRSEVMSAVFNAIKRGQTFRFPAWRDFKDPFASDMLAIFSEYNERRRVVEYKKAPNNTDDSFHSLLFCFLASMPENPQPEIFAPSFRIDRELELLS